MEPIISIIVPVYNCEKHLSKCIDSILAQSYPYLQIILVNDGSTDGSGRICEDYASKDSRVQVIHQKNQGVSAARNAGLDVVTGEYLLLVDGDDTLSLDAVETALRGFADNEIDVAVFGVTKNWEEENRAQKLPIEPGFYSREEMLYGVLKDYASCGAGYPFNKLWRIKAFGQTADIPRFDRNLYFFEDLEWVVRMLLRVKKANLLPFYCYQYRIHPDSVTHRPDAQQYRETGYHESIWRIMEALEEVPPVLHWFSEKYYPEIVNGVIHARRHGYQALQTLLLEKMEQLKDDILASESVSGKVKMRCRVFRFLDKIHVL